MEEKEEGISLGEIFHVIFIKKWLLLAITVLVMLAGIILVQAFYNPSKEVYVTTFEIRYPDSDIKRNPDSDIKRYPDGTEFVYREFISYENLVKAKASSPDFESIDIDKISTRNAISIVEEEYVDNTVTVKTGLYIITVSKKYFKTPELASSFINALVNVPVDYIVTTSKDMDFGYHLHLFDGAGDYLSQIEALEKQKNLLLENYKVLIENYSSGYKTTLADQTEKTLVVARTELESYFSRNSLEALITEVKANGYIKAENANYKSSIEKKIEELEIEHSLNDTTLDAYHKELDTLKNILSTSQSLVTDSALLPIMEEISKLTKRNAEIEHLIEMVYKPYLREELDATYDEDLLEFQKKLNTHYAELKKFTSVYHSFSDSIYADNSKVVFDNGTVITESGGINILIALVGCLVVGFVVGCCLNLALDLPKFLKSKKENPAEIDSEEQPKETE